MHQEGCPRDAKAHLPLMRSSGDGLKRPASILRYTDLPAPGGPMSSVMRPCKQHGPVRTGWSEGCEL